MKKKFLAILLATVLALSFGLGFAAPVAAADGNGVETCSFTCTEVVKCPEGYGQAVFHINGHCVCFDEETAKCDLHIQGKVTCKPPGGKNVTIHFQKKLVCNGQAGDDGIFNGQCMFSVNGAGVDNMKFHLVWHYDSCSCTCCCQVVPY